MWSPYGSSAMGGDRSDDDPPFMSSASPFEDDNPEDQDRPRDKKKKQKKKKRQRHKRHRCKDAKAIATSNTVVNLSEFMWQDLSEVAKSFGRLLRMTARTYSSGRVKCDLLLQCCKKGYLEKRAK